MPEVRPGRLLFNAPALAQRAVPPPPFCLPHFGRSFPDSFFVTPGPPLPRVARRPGFASFQHRCFFILPPLPFRRKTGSSMVFISLSQFFYCPFPPFPFFSHAMARVSTVPIVELGASRRTSSVKREPNDCSLFLIPNLLVGSICFCPRAVFHPVFSDMAVNFV